MSTYHIGFDAEIKDLSHVFDEPFSVPAVKGLKCQIFKAG